MTGRQRLDGLQSLRGIAALAVLVQHVTVYVCAMKQIDYHPYTPLDLGSFGVQVFFVISGFVMAGCMGQGRAFLANRALRIYPAFWLSIIASFFLLDGWFPWSFDWLSTTLFPSQNLNSTYLIPYWTLVYEMAFYLVTYGMILIGRQHATKLCLLWLVVVLAVSQFHDVAAPTPGLWIFVSKLDVFFIAGMLAALHRDRLFKLPAMPLAVATVALWIGGESIGRYSLMAYDVTLAAAFALLVVRCAPRLNAKPLVWFGDMSFGVYLLHVPVAMFAIHLVLVAHPTIELAPLWVLTMVAAVTGATAFGMVEHRLYTVLKKATRVRRHTAVIESGVLG